MKYILVHPWMKRMAVHYNIEIEDLIYGLPLKKKNGKSVHELTRYQFVLRLTAIINSHKNRLNKIP